MTTKMNIPFTRMSAAYHQTVKSIQTEMERNLQKSFSMEEHGDRLKMLHNAKAFPKTLTVQPIELRVRQDLDIISGGTAHQRMLDNVRKANETYQTDVINDLYKAARLHQVQACQIRAPHTIESKVKEAVSEWSSGFPDAYKKFENKFLKPMQDTPPGTSPISKVQSLAKSLDEMAKIIKHDMSKRSLDTRRAGEEKKARAEAEKKGRRAIYNPYVSKARRQSTRSQFC